MKITPNGEIPYNGDTALDLPEYEGTIVLTELNQKVLVTMTFLRDFIEYAKTKGRSFPVTKQECELSNLDKSFSAKAEKVGAIKCILVFAPGLKGARSCYVPTEYGRAIIKELNCERENRQNNDNAGTSGSGDSVQSSIGSLE